MPLSKEQQFKIKDQIMDSVKTLIGLVEEGTDNQGENIKKMKSVCVKRINYNINNFNKVFQRKMNELKAAILEEDWGKVEVIYNQLKS